MTRGGFININTKKMEKTKEKKKVNTSNSQTDGWVLVCCGCCIVRQPTGPVCM